MFYELMPAADRPPQRNATAANHGNLLVSIRAWLLLLAAVAGISASTSPAQAQAIDASNPCSLLTASEVEAVIGEPLAGPPYRADGTEPSPAGHTCRYDTASFRAISVDVDWTDGAQAFGLMNMISSATEVGGLKGVLTLSDGTELNGAWDHAQVFMCCEFNALHGEQRVMIDIGSTNAAIEQAGGLADLAVQRLAHSLEVDSSSGINEALAHNQDRPAIASACTLVTRADAELLLDATLLQDPQGDESSCTYFWTPAGADYQEQIRLLVTWRGGFGEMRRAQAAIGMGLDMLADAGLDMTENSSTKEAGFDAYATSIIGVMAVRKDVMLSIESGPMTDLAAKFIAIAAAKL